MRPSLKVVALAGLGLASVWGVVRSGGALAQEQAKVERSTRGGLLAKTEHHQFEVFFYPSGVRVFPRDHSGAAIDATKLDAAATFYHPNSPKPWFERPLRGMGESLDLAIGLANAPRTGARVTFRVIGLPGGDESMASFTVPLEFVPEPTSQPAAPAAATAPSPRYVYAPGYYGYGYYAYPGPQTTPSPAASAPTHYSAPRSYGSPRTHFRGDGDSVGPGHRDWSTGRDVPLAKPWLRPMD
jgi:hypothetical protein